MTLTTKFLILAALAIGEALSLVIVARRLPAERRGPILPVMAISAIVTLSLAGYFLVYFV